LAQMRTGNVCDLGFCLIVTKSTLDYIVVVCVCSIKVENDIE